MHAARRGRVVPIRKIDDRRRNPRVELLTELYGCVVALDLPVLVRNASLGGFSVESPCQFPIGSEHSFRFQTLDGGSTTIVAICRHTQPLSRSERSPRYSAGFEFLPQRTENLRRALSAIAAATVEDAATVTSGGSR